MWNLSDAASLKVYGLHIQEGKCWDLFLWRVQWPYQSYIAPDYNPFMTSDSLQPADLIPWQAGLSLNRVENSALLKFLASTTTSLQYFVNFWRVWFVKCFIYPNVYECLLQGILGDGRQNIRGRKKKSLPSFLWAKYLGKKAGTKSRQLC